MAQAVKDEADVEQREQVVHVVEELEPPSAPHASKGRADDGSQDGSQQKAGDEHAELAMEPWGEVVVPASARWGTVSGSGRGSARWRDAHDVVDPLSASVDNGAQYDHGGNDLVHGDGEVEGEHYGQAVDSTRGRVKHPGATAGSQVRATHRVDRRAVSSALHIGRRRRAQLKSRQRPQPRPSGVMMPLMPG